jgi:hypothetical protein
MDVVVLEWHDAEREEGHERVEGQQQQPQVGQRLHEHAGALLLHELRRRLVACAQRHWLRREEGAEGGSIAFGL